MIGAFTQSNVWAAIGPDRGVVEIYENQRAPAVLSSYSIGMIYEVWQGLIPLRCKMLHAVGYKARFTE